MKLKPIPTLLIGTLLCTLLSLLIPTSAAPVRSRGLTDQAVTTGGRGRSRGEASESGRVALFFSDIKQDDMSAIASLHKSEPYSKVVVVIEAVDDKERAAQVLRDFMAESFPEEEGRPDMAVLIGHTDPDGETGHEEPWKRFQFASHPDPTPSFSAAALNALVGNKEVEVYQISPTSDKDVEELLASDAKVVLFHITHGYNTTAKDRDTAGQTKYLQTIRKRLVKRASRKGQDKPLVIVTDRGSTQWSQDGSTIPLSDIDGRVPKQHLFNALLDKFALSQLQDVDQLMVKYGGQLKSMGVSFERIRFAPQQWSEDPMNVIAFSRVNWNPDVDTKQALVAEKLREFYLHQAQNALKFVKDLRRYQDELDVTREDQETLFKLSFRLNPETGGVPATFRKDSGIELYDMVHAVAVARARVTKLYTPFRAEAQEGGIAKLVPTQGKDFHGYMLHGPVDQGEIKEQFKDLWPQRADFGSVRDVARGLLPV